MSALEQILAANPGAETFRFGDSRALCDEVLALVRAGTKTATCGALRDYEGGAETMPEVGRRDVALEWDGRPAVLIETVEVTIRPFDAVDAALVADMGEFRDPEHFAQGYGAYFERNGGFDPKMKLVCERFRMIEDYDAHALVGKDAASARARTPTPRAEAAGEKK